MKKSKLRKFNEVKSYIKNADKFLLLLILIFAAFGLVVVFSSSNITAVLFYHYEPTYFFFKQLTFTVIGLIAMFLLAYFIPEKHYFWVSIIGIILLFILFMLLRAMGSINDSQSWYSFNGTSFQPSEFAKPVIIVFLACWYNNFRKYDKWWKLFIPVGVVVFLCAFIALEPDLGTAGVIAFITMLIVLTLPVKDKIMNWMRIGVILVGIVGIISLYLFQPYFINKESTSRQESRFAFTNPCSRSLAKTGYQVCNAYIAINNGGLFGRGFGQSTQKFLYLPEAYTDFVFPIVVEEIGLLGATGVLLAYLLLLFQILVIARNATNLQDSIIAFGTFSYILVHILINLAGVLALIPMTGIPLPFLSYGGSFLLNLFVLLGLTLRVSANNKIAKKG